MAVQISKYHEIMKRLSEENKTELLNKPEDLEAIKLVNEQMEELRRDFQVKEKKSQESSQQVVLNA
jgi:hypothetical protein